MIFGFLSVCVDEHRAYYIAMPKTQYSYITSCQTLRKLSERPPARDVEFCFHFARVENAVPRTEAKIRQLGAIA